MCYSSKEKPLPYLSVDSLPVDDDQRKHRREEHNYEFCNVQNKYMFM